MLLLYETWFIILMLILFPPFGVLLVFKTALWEDKYKIISVVISVIWLILIIVGGYFLINYFFGKDNDIGNNPVDTPVVETPIDNPNTDDNTDNDTDDNPNPNDNPDNPDDSNEVPNDNPDDIFNEDPNSNPNDIPGGETDKEPIEDSNNETGSKGLSPEEIANLTEDKKIEYFLGKKLENYEIKIKSITKEKYDVSFLKNSDNGNIVDLFKEICETIVELNYKDKFMEVVLTINIQKEKKIMTVKSFSKEILPNINCSLFENGKLQSKQITIKLNKE